MRLARRSALGLAPGPVVALALVLGPGRARADDDVRFPLRAGFLYSGVTRGPAFSLSTAVEVDVARITPRLALTLVAGVDTASRLDLPDEEPRSAFSDVGLGAGLFYVTEGSVAFGLETTAALTFDNDDLVGGGFATRAYLIPFYVPFSEAVEGSGDHFGAWVRSSISIWVLGRVNFTSDGNGGSLAFGASLDLARILFLPSIDALSHPRPHGG